MDPLLWLVCIIVFWLAYLAGWAIRGRYDAKRAADLRIIHLSGVVKRDVQ